MRVPPAVQRVATAGALIAMIDGAAAPAKSAPTGYAALVQLSPR